MHIDAAFKYLKIIIFGLCAGIAGAFSFSYFQNGEDSTEFIKIADEVNPKSVLYSTIGTNADFIKASEIARPSVVYIKVQSQGRQTNPYGWDPFFDFFGNIGPVSSSGSGVIISSDGYIVTNAHVVQNAETIEVVMNNNKRSYIAKVVGIDASTDIALIKVEGSNLPSITFTNSDELPIGAWVLAVGNPFNLTSTVTAGIVSAKGRNINLVQNQFPIESFIQTDAAINPGNSGGALVNLEGKLVGINTAILSKTGSYTGYGFAIPANIVKKVLSDIKEFGYVQRAFIEAEIIDIDETLAKKLNQDNVNGVYVNAVIQDGNAEKNGLKKGDVIIKADGKLIDSKALFEEQLAYHRPGEKIKLTVKRGSDIKELEILLTNMHGTTSLEKEKTYHSDYLGADFEEITKLEKQKYNVTSGIRVFNITGGQIAKMSLPEGFIIYSLNGQQYQSPQELINALEKVSGRIRIEGINPNGSRGVYSFYLF